MVNYMLLIHPNCAKKQISGFYGRLRTNIVNLQLVDNYSISINNRLEGSIKPVSFSSILYSLSYRLSSTHCLLSFSSSSLLLTFPPFTSPSLSIPPPPPPLFRLSSSFYCCLPSFLSFFPLVLQCQQSQGLVLCLLRRVLTPCILPKATSYTPTPTPTFSVALRKLYSSRYSLSIYPSIYLSLSCSARQIFMIFTRSFPLLHHRN